MVQQAANGSGHPAFRRHNLPSAAMKDTAAPDLLPVHLQPTAEASPVRVGRGSAPGRDRPPSALPVTLLPPSALLGAHRAAAATAPTHRCCFTRSWCRSSCLLSTLTSCQRLRRGSSASHSNHADTGYREEVAHHLLIPRNCRDLLGPGHIPTPLLQPALAGGKPPQRYPPGSGLHLLLCGLRAVGA